MGLIAGLFSLSVKISYRHLSRVYSSVLPLSIACTFITLMFFDTPFSSEYMSLKRSVVLSNRKSRLSVVLIQRLFLLSSTIVMTLRGGMSDLVSRRVAYCVNFVPSYDISPYHVPSHSSPSRSLRDP